MPQPRSTPTGTQAPTAAPPSATAPTTAAVVTSPPSTCRSSAGSRSRRACPSFRPGACVFVIAGLRFVGPSGRCLPDARGVLASAHLVSLHFKTRPARGRGDFFGPRSGRAAETGAENQNGPAEGRAPGEAGGAARAPAPLSPLGEVRGKGAPLGGPSARWPPLRHPHPERGSDNDCGEQDGAGQRQQRGA